MMLAVAERKNQIPYWLKSRGLTVYGLSKKTQMPYHQVDRIVNSPTIPDGIEYKTLRRLAEALEVTLDQLETEE
jgi:hypothetical protein